MAPFHPLRRETWAFTSRAVAALAVFFAIALVLMVGAVKGQANADDLKGDVVAEAASPVHKTPGAEGVPPPEPVLGNEPVVIEPPELPEASPSEGPPVGEKPPAEEKPPPAEEPSEEGSAPPGEEPSGEGSAPSGEEPSGEEPSGDESSGDESSSGEEPSGDESSDEEPSDESSREQPSDEESSGEESSGEDVEDPSSGGDKGGEEEMPAPDRRAAARTAPPDSGGSKTEDEPDTPSETGDEAEPAPVAREGVTLPTESVPSSTPETPGSLPTDTPATPGGGIGHVNDPAEPNGADGPGNMNFELAQATGGDGGTGDPPGDGGTAGETGADGAGAGATDGAGAGGADGGDAGGASPGDGGEGEGDEGAAGDNEPDVVTETVRDIVEVVPDSLKAALAALAALSLLLGMGYLFAALRARRLARQRRELLQEVGLLQTALLPPVPDKVGALRTSVAYRPADGPGAGGDFYDVLPLPGGRVGFILGDVSGHGRGALARTAFMRYTLRAYLEAGLEPRVALQVAGRVIDDNLGGDFATVLLAVHDPETGSLTYATAGHPAPIVVGPEGHDPVTAGSSPPIGVGVRTGLRQTTVPLVPGSVACLFTDGLMEARTEDGILGRERLAELLAEIGDEASARRLIEAVAAESKQLSDDMAAVVVSPTAGATAGLFRTEQLELSGRELEGPIARRFLEACGLSEAEVDAAERDARELADRFGGVVLHVVFGNRLRVEVLPRNVESIEAASRRVSAGTSA